MSKYTVVDTSKDIEMQAYYIRSVFYWSILDKQSLLNGMLPVKQFVVKHNHTSLNQYDNENDANTYMNNVKIIHERQKESANNKRIENELEIYNNGRQAKLDNKSLDNLNYTPFTWRYDAYMKGYNNIK